MGAAIFKTAGVKPIPNIPSVSDNICPAKLKYLNTKRSPSDTANGTPKHIFLKPPSLFSMKKAPIYVTTLTAHNSRKLPTPNPR